MNNDDKTPDEPINGAAAAAKIINEMPAGSRDRILAAISEAAPDTFKKIKSNIVRFDDIPIINDSGIQVLIGKMNHNDLVLAVTYGSISIKEALLRNMSERKARAVLLDSQHIATASQKDISNMESRFVATIDELRKAGVIRTESSDDIWV